MKMSHFREQGMIRKIRSLFRKKGAISGSWKVFKELTDSLNLIEDLNQIGANFLGKIKEFVPVRQIVLYVYSRDLGRFVASNSLGFEDSLDKFPTISRHSALAKWLKVNKTYFSLRDQPGVFRFLGKQEQEILSAWSVEVCFPLVAMNRLIGLIFLGSKTVLAPYTSEELSLLTYLLPQISIALENAILFKEQRERFRRMMRADRLATIGELAAGAAHEIRNPLTVIKSSLQFLKAKNQDDKSLRLLATALQETGRIEEILAGLLSFARPSDIKKEAVDLLAILRESLDLVAFEAKKKNLHLSEAFPPAPISLLADGAHLKQLFLNVLLNAIQATNDGGRIGVEAVFPDENAVLVTVADTGEGIAPEHLDKIFDPFFTTKKGGTGLGLSICYGIVKSHGGEIDVSSRPGAGTSVMIKLPRSFWG